MLLLASLAAATPTTQPWPSEKPFTYELSIGRAWFSAPSLGGEFVAATGGHRTFRWTCSARPATRAGRQQMTCTEPGLGEIWLLWGPGRRLMEIDISEDDPTKEQAGDRQRVAQLAGALEGWPEVAEPYTWPYQGRGDAWLVAQVKGATTFDVHNTVSSVDAERIVFRTAGEATLLLAAGGATEARLKVTIEGETTLNRASGLLETRTIRAFPSAESVGGQGTGGHEITVKLAPP